MKIIFSLHSLINILILASIKAVSCQLEVEWATLGILDDVETYRRISDRI